VAPEPAGGVPASEHDEFHLLTPRRAWRLPTPPQQRTTATSSSRCQLVVCSGAAESAGVDVFTGFAAAEPLLGADGAVAGVQLGDMGRAHDGSEGPNFAPGAELRAPLTVLAEGCRGSLTKQLTARFGLDAGRSPPSYGLGFKELWQLPPGRAQPGLVRHTVGWPLDHSTYGGGFIYHLGGNQVYVGLIVGLDYADPRLQPFEAFQRFKHHPSIRPLLEGGEPLVYGARTIAAGGWQALPQMEMPGASATPPALMSA
jgi:electron-transferring-flavoprotein dehydrogenase